MLGKNWLECMIGKTEGVDVPIPKISRLLSTVRLCRSSSGPYCGLPGGQENEPSAVLSKAKPNSGRPVLISISWSCTVFIVQIGTIIAPPWHGPAKEGKRRATPQKPSLTGTTRIIPRDGCCHSSLRRRSSHEAWA